MASKKGSNVKTGGTPAGPLVVDPSHPGIVAQPQVPGGPYYGQSGASGGKGK